MLKLTSSAFTHHASIPSQFTCDGTNEIPPLTIENVPPETKSLVLVVDDPDIPEMVKHKMNIDVFDHWVLYNIPPDTTDISTTVVEQSLQGIHSGGNLGYTGPCPPDGEHRYFFKLYALDGMLDLPESPTKQAVESAMHGHVLEQTVLIGLYKRLN